MGGGGGGAPPPPPPLIFLLSIKPLTCPLPESSPPIAARGTSRVFWAIKARVERGKFKLCFLGHGGRPPVSL